MTTTLTLGDLTLSVPERAAGEAAFIYREIFEQGCYFKHDVSVKNGDVVFDVGANIGLFSLYLARKYPQARIHAFEPTPPILACARANLAAYPQVTLHGVGLAEAEKELDILYFPRAPGNSTLYAHDKQDECDALSSGFRMSDVWGTSKLHFLALSLLYPVRRPLLRSYFASRFREGVSYRCLLSTLDRVIDEQHIDRIDLLKVDVEGAEVDVFSGLSDDNLEKVVKVALEVSPRHKPWVPKLTARLRRVGFARVVTESVVPRSDHRRDVYPCVVFAVR